MEGAPVTWTYFLFKFQFCPRIHLRLVHLTLSRAEIREFLMASGSQNTKQKEKSGGMQLPALLESFVYTPFN